MKTIYADFNAMTESGHVSLTTVGSQEDIARTGLRPGDWAWLSDGELIVGAQLAIDDRHGLVGVADWETLVHLDDEGANDFDLVSRELAALLIKEPYSKANEPRLFQLLAELEHIAPHIGNDWPEPPAFRRAVALRQMGKLRLALLEANEARQAQPDSPMVIFLELDLLRLEDLPSAGKEAERIAEAASVPALVLSGCINVLATQAEQAADDEFKLIADRVLALCRRLDQAPDRDQPGEPLLALAEFNRGLVHLRASRISQAQNAFRRAQQIYPTGPMLDAIAALETYDRHAREVARRVREIAEQWSPPTPVAA